MNAEHFVGALKAHVINAAVDDTISNLENPPGRRVSEAERALSQWYKQLSPKDAENLRSVLAQVSHQAVFGVLAVIDGVRTVDDGVGHFELAYVAKVRNVLNDPELPPLHDLLNATDM